MKVVIKNPGEAMKVAEVADLKEINKIVGNVDANGEGYNKTGSDCRQGVFNGIDIHMNTSALFNPKLSENFWDVGGFRLYCGSVVFAGYNEDSHGSFGVCSLTDEQIEYLKENIHKVYEIHS